MKVRQSSEIRREGQLRGGVKRVAGQRLTAGRGRTRAPLYAQAEGDDMAGLSADVARGVAYFWRQRGGNRSLD